MIKFNLWQHSLWQKFQESLGRKTWRLTADHASALVIRHPLPLGLCWFEIPRGPIAPEGHSADKLFEEVVAIAKKEKAIFVRLSPYEEIRISNFEFRISSQDHHPETSLIIDLAQSEDDILKQMKPKGRYNIKVAQKNGVTVTPSHDIDAFYHLLKKTTGRDGFAAHPISYYRKILESLAPHAQLLLAHYEGKPVAGGIFVYLHDSGIYYYGASDYEHRNLMAPYLIQWTAIQEAKKRGCKHYDFLGIAPEGAPPERSNGSPVRTGTGGSDRAGKNHPWAGVTEFKHKFGGAVVHYPKAQELIIKRFWYWVYQAYKRIRNTL